MTTTEPISVTVAEFAMLCRVAAGDVGWRNNRPGHAYPQDHYHTLNDRWASGAALSAIRGLSQKMLITETAPWVLVTDMGRDLLSGMTAAVSGHLAAACDREARAGAR